MILDFLARSCFFLDLLARIIAKILARNLKNPRFWQEMRKIQDLGKKFKIIQDYPRSWQENQDAKHWVFISKRKCNRNREDIFFKVPKYRSFSRNVRVILLAVMASDELFFKLLTIVFLSSIFSLSVVISVVSMFLVILMHCIKRHHQYFARWCPFPQILQTLGSVVFVSYSLLQSLSLYYQLLISRPV